MKTEIIKVIKDTDEQKIYCVWPPIPEVKIYPQDITATCLVIIDAYLALYTKGETSIQMEDALFKHLNETREERHKYIDTVNYKNFKLGSSDTE